MTDDDEMWGDDKIVEWQAENMNIRAICAGMISACDFAESREGAARLAEANEFQPWETIGIRAKALPRLSHAAAEEIFPGAGFSVRFGFMLVSMAAAGLSIEKFAEADTPVGRAVRRYIAQEH